jgi:hypothetical protein
MNDVPEPSLPPPDPPHRFRRVGAVIMAIVGAAVALLLAAQSLVGIYQFWDVGSQSWFARLQGDGEQYKRGAAYINEDEFGDTVDEVRYLQQNWKPADSLWFYNTTQGSDLIPYDFFLTLRQTGSQALFRDNRHMNSFRYLPQNKTFSNPDGLPVGFVKDTYQGREYVGLTCAACHTGQVNFNHIGYRIDGGPAGADMKSFVERLAEALRATNRDPVVRAQFVKDVLARRGDYSTEKAVTDDVFRFSQRISTYAVVNSGEPDAPIDYGFYRLDAFGRIYNRVLEHLLSGKAFVGVLQRMVTDTTITQKQMKGICLCTDEDDLPRILSDDDRDHLVERVQHNLDAAQQRALREILYNRASAPVSYPFLWDTPQHDYVQWNGLAANAGLGPVGRNAGEAIGVFGTLDWAIAPLSTISSIVSGQGFKGTHISFKSSVNVRNLSRLERHLVSLESPQWPETFPKLQPDKVDRGRRLFGRYCATCHEDIRRDDKDRRVVAHLSRLPDIGTDRTMADNGANYSGLSGIIRNEYANAGVGDILLDQAAPVAALLTKATLSVVATPDPDRNFLVRGFDWVYDLLASLSYNDIKPSVKHGDYDPDTTEDPYASLRAYKGRSLNGIWATAPYLHNGSVPTLYDLLLPKNGEVAAQDGEYRPDTFMVGSREFKPEKVGLKWEGYKGFLFDTTLKGNSNAGHEYGTRPDVDRFGDPLPPLTREQRCDLIEYLKSL